MNISGIDAPETPQHSSTTMSSPVASVFSRGHASHSSTSNSSLASSPLPRDSFDLYASRLGKVTEEPQEIDNLEGYTLVDRAAEAGDEYDQYFVSDKSHTLYGSTFFSNSYDLSEQDSTSPPLAGRPHSKRQRSADYPATAGGSRFSRVSSSISRRWRNRSGAGPQLSIITHMSAPGSRSGSTASSQLASPVLSAVSRHESCLPPSPVATTIDEALHAAAMEIPYQQTAAHSDEQAQAATPLLPPVFNELSTQENPIHSPLQSPSIAPIPNSVTGRTSMDKPGMTSLPSPPLSTKPSMVSMRQRSRANTATASPMMDIPPLQLIDEANDPWAQSLGHANFNIHPEPYFPEHVDLASYTEFRANWDQARTNYAKHLARAIEHNGATSKVSKLTEEKWAIVDGRWKNYNESMTKLLSPVLKKLSDSDTDMHDSQASMVLEKPVSRIIMPEIDDKCGKFPELGDGDIVGPMAVGPRRNVTPTRTSPAFSTPPSSPTSPRKRNFFRFLSDMLKGT